MHRQSLPITAVAGVTIVSMVSLVVSKLRDRSGADIAHDAGPSERSMVSAIPKRPESAMDLSLFDARFGSSLVEHVGLSTKLPYSPGTALKKEIERPTVLWEPSPTGWQLRGEYYRESVYVDGGEVVPITTRSFKVD